MGSTLRFPPYDDAHDLSVNAVLSQDKIHRLAVCAGRHKHRQEYRQIKFEPKPQCASPIFVASLSVHWISRMSGFSLNTHGLCVNNGRKAGFPARYSSRVEGHHSQPPIRCIKNVLSTIGIILFCTQSRHPIKVGDGNCICLDL